MDLDDEIEPSILQVRGSQGRLQASERTRDVATMSSHGLLSVMTCWMCCKHKTTEKSKAAAMLGGMLSCKATIPDRLSSFVAGHIPDVQGLCPDALLGRSCSHISEVVHVCEHPDETLAADRNLHLVRILECAGIRYLRCNACARLVNLLLVDLAATIDTRMAEPSAGIDPCRLPTLRTPAGNERRMDEDKRKYLTQELCRKRKSGHANAIASSIQVESKRLRYWHSQEPMTPCPSSEPHRPPITKTLLEVICCLASLLRC